MLRIGDRPSPPPPDQRARICPSAWAGCSCPRGSAMPYHATPSLGLLRHLQSTPILHRLPQPCGRRANPRISDSAGRVQGGGVRGGGLPLALARGLLSADALVASLVRRVRHAPTNPTSTAAAFVVPASLCLASGRTRGSAVSVGAVVAVMVPTSEHTIQRTGPDHPTCRATECDCPRCLAKVVHVGWRRCRRWWRRARRDAARGRREFPSSWVLDSVARTWMMIACQMSSLIVQVVMVCWTDTH
jgi:hypothetical protein